MKKKSLKIKILAAIVASSFMVLPVKAENVTVPDPMVKNVTVPDPMVKNATVPDTMVENGTQITIPVTLAGDAKPTDEIKKIIKYYYLYDVDDKIFNTDNPQEIVKRLKDPYSTYFTKDEYQHFVNSINRNFVGIGIYINKCDDGIEITGFTEDSSAEKSGLKVGDIITKANDVELKDLSSDEAVEYIKGSEGTSVNVVVKRGDMYFNKTIERKTVNMPNVIYEVLKGDIGYIKLVTFSENAPRKIREAIVELKKKNVNSYIIDLMNNPGGYLSSGVNTAGYFIGNEVAVRLTNNRGKIVEYKAPSYDQKIDKPTVFLINNDSASASEILSAAVKDYKKAIFIGENTFGKGVAQSLFTLNDGSVLKLTTEKFVSPLGNEINKVGVKPDIEYKGNNIGAIETAQIYLSTDKPQVSEYKGKDRYETCAMISKSGWQISDYAVLVTGEDYADALSSVTLAKKFNAPILITKSNELTPATSSEIKRLKVKNVFIVGGQGAISNNIEEKLTSQRINCSRISGENRYDTSARIAEYLAKQNNDASSQENKAVVVSGESFADALSAASYAASNNIPILLTEKMNIPAITYKYLRDNNIIKTYVIGGSGVVSDKVLNELPNGERISGKDRYLTNTAILDKFSKEFNIDNVYAAKGNNYPDALTSAALAAKTKSPIILTRDTNSIDLLKYVNDNLKNIKNMYMLGGAEIKGL